MDKLKLLWPPALAATLAAALLTLASFKCDSLLGQAIAHSIPFVSPGASTLACDPGPPPPEPEEVNAPPANYPANYDDYELPPVVDDEEMDEGM